jgi:GNAT superfamily N-acetyltransferase
MWFRVSRARWNAGKGEGNRRAFQAFVKSGQIPGLLAYERGVPVGWVAVEPRDAYPRLENSRNLARVDDVPVWSITCFYVSRQHRGRGLMRALVDAAVAHARRRGAPAIEAYPVDYSRKVGDAWVFSGAASVFRAAGFEEVARRSPTRPIYRKRLSVGRR